MNNNTDNCDFAEIEILKRIVHEEAEAKSIEAAQEDEEEATPKLPVDLSLKKRLDNLPKKDNKTVPLSIFRIPADIRERGKVFYEPRVVSIGPFYRGSENLRAMEEQKIYLLRDFLARFTEIDLKVLVEEIKQLEDMARRSYAETINLDSHGFVEMLLLDGCFILESAIKWSYNDADRLKHVSWVANGVFADLLLVENQIPFFVVMKMINLIQANCGKRYAELLDLLVKYIGAFAESKFIGIGPFQVDAHTLNEARNSRNLLHLFYRLLVPKRMSYQSNPKHAPAPSRRQRLFNSFRLCIHPQPYQGDVKQVNEETVYVLPCVTELLQSGIIFRQRKSPIDLFDITFQDGVIEMPPVSLSPQTKMLLLNIVAFEQSNGEKDFLPFSSYVALMEDLVRTSKDVVALRQCGIIYTLDPSEEEAALFFNHAGQLCYLDCGNHYFVNLFREIKCCYDGRQNKLKNVVRVR